MPSSLEGMLTTIPKSFTSSNMGITSMDYVVWLHSSTDPTSTANAAEVMITRRPPIILVWGVIVPAAKEHVPGKIKVVAPILNLENNVPFTAKTVSVISTVQTVSRPIKNQKARKKWVAVKSTKSVLFVVNSIRWTQRSHSGATMTHAVTAMSL